MKKYTVTTTENLRSLCIKNNWFTEGSNKQYEKLFYANENGCPIEQIATIIWVCSDDDWCRRDILDELKLERIKYFSALFNISFGHRFRFWNENGDHLVCTLGQFCDVISDPKEEWDLDSVVRVERKRSYGKSETIWERGEE